MRYIGLKAGGGEILLPAPAELRFDSAEDAPADGFVGVFPLAGGCGTLVGLRVEDAAGGVRFLGTADMQRQTVSGGETALRLTCRSLAGPLLDSEPEPQTYEYPNLATIFARHIRPYGLTAFLGDARIFRGPLRVAKGMSEWQAAALFCKTYLRTAPRVRGTVFDATGIARGKPILLDNAAGVKYFRAELRLRRCELLTEIWTPTAEGSYAPAAADAGSVALGVRRKRCLAAGSPADAEELLRAAGRRSFAVLADCPGYPRTEVGAPAELRDPTLGTFAGLTVAEVACAGGPDGVRTRYTMRKG